MVDPPDSVGHLAIERSLEERVTRDKLESDLAAIREGLADVDAGRTIPLKQAFQESARELGLPDPTG
ncbi:MAG TPA: hypothetical protein VM452_14300 [Caulifigura sp.]|jgi:predicted transcriptional regulator|nr:hypothetical protein [Caulifigura sp.]